MDKTVEYLCDLQRKYKFHMTMSVADLFYQPNALTGEARIKAIASLTRALAICYIEEGMEYCQKDERGVVLNPNEKREALFKERFPGDEFLNFFGFFLHEYESRRNAILALQVVRMEAQRIAIMKKVRQTASGLHGQESSSGWLRNLVGRLTKSQGSRT